MGQAKRERRLKAVEHRALGHVQKITIRTGLKQDSRLLALSAEIRNSIYDLAADNYPIATVSTRNRKLVPPPIANTCRQLQNEFLSIYNATALLQAPKPALVHRTQPRL